MRELISVIVPVYKVEKYLDRCVSSIVNQTYKNLEIILVDDGSPDSCSEMCDEWAKKDSRIKVIHTENGGGARARNIGLDASIGDIIAFVDSDDFLSEVMYEQLADLMTEDVDIAECGIVLTDGDSADFEEQKAVDAVYCDANEAMKYHVNDIIFRQTPPNKLYRRSVIGNVRFTEGKKIDDEFFTYLVIGKSRKLVHIDNRLYAYRQQPESVMHTKFDLKRLQAVEAKLLRLVYVEKHFPDCLSAAKTNIINTCIFLGQMSLLYMNEEGRSEAFETLKKALNSFKISAKDMSGEKIKQRLWITLAKVSLPLCCKIRNLLKIGI